MGYFAGAGVGYLAGAEGYCYVFDATGSIVLVLSGLRISALGGSFLTSVLEAIFLGSSFFYSSF